MEAFLAECWTRLRDTSRISSVLPRIDFGGALDTTAVNKTINGLLKLMQPNPETSVSDELLEWVVKIVSCLQTKLLIFFRLSNFFSGQHLVFYS